MSSKIIPFLTLKIENNKVIFQDQKELDDWVRTEKDNFSWIRDTIRDIPEAKKIADSKNQYLSQLTEYSNTINNAENTPDDENKQELESFRAQQENELKERLKRIEREVKYFHSKSPLGIFLNQVREDHSDLAAASAAANIFSIDFRVLKPDHVVGISRAVEYITNGPSKPQALVDTLEETLNYWKSQYYKQVRRHGTFLRKFLSTIEELKSNERHRLESFSGFIEKWETDLNSLRRSYDDFMELRASVNYWKRKKAIHANRAWMYLILTLIAASISTLVFVQLSVTLLDSPISQVPLSRIALTAGIASLLIWIIRFVSRLFISQFHLLSDAEERITMIYTYLAMVRENVGPEKSDRQLILQTVFRPSTTGIIKEEGPRGNLELFNPLFRPKE